MSNFLFYSTSPNKNKNKKTNFFRMTINCSRAVNSVHIYKDWSTIPAVRAKRDSITRFSDTALIPRRKRNASGHAGNNFSAFLSCALFLISESKIYLTRESRVILAKFQQDKLFLNIDKKKKKYTREHCSFFQ